MSTKKLCALCGELPAASSRHKYCMVNCDRQKAYRAKCRKSRVTSDDIIRDLRQEVQYLTDLVQELLSGSVSVAAAPVSVSGNLKALEGVPKVMPARQSDDDLMGLLEVKEVKSEGGQAAQNFINSMMALANS